MKILVSGGAGYIGSFTARLLLEKNHEVLILDSLITGHKQNIPQDATFEQADIGDNNKVSKILTQHKPDAVIHFAAFISMGESMKNPKKYFDGNTFATYNFLKTLIKHDINKFIFSSTAGVYGDPEHVPIQEDHPKNPRNPYGESKLIVEKLLHWLSTAHDFNYVTLRYFNAAGASLDGRYGEDHKPESHLIPNAINSIIENKQFSLFGNDYNTKDGTCVRDYIHVLDLANAHLLALEKLKDEKGEFTYNVGTGKGFSNMEILNTIEQVSDQKICITVKPRRPGDTDELIADPSKINNDLNFTPIYSDLKTIIDSAWKYHSRR